MNNYFARQELVLNSETGEKIKNTKVLIVGAGAGGNEVLKNLALMGFGQFTIVDFDPIEDSNLSRTTLFTKSDIGKSKAEIAANALKSICLHEAPSINGINAKIQDTGKQIFLEHDIIVCCVDTMDARAYINDWCVKLNKPFFEMGFEKFTVQITFFPNENVNDACLRELIGYGDFVGTRQSCSKLKMEDINLAHIPTIQVAAALAGVFIATEIVLFLRGDSRLKNKMLQYAAEYHNSFVVDVPQNPKCFNHEGIEYSLFKTNLIAKDNTFNELLSELKNKLNSDYFIHWDEEFIYSFECEECKKELLIKKFKSQVYDKERWCSECIEKEHYKSNVDVRSKWIFNKELDLINPKHTFFTNLRISDFGIKEKDIIVVNDMNSNNKKILVLI